MIETLSLVLALVAWRFAGRDILRRPMVDSSQGRLVQTAGAFVLRQPVAANEHCPGGFYFVGRGHWERLLVCLVGFVMARLIVTRLTRAAEKPAHRAQAGSHAP